MARVRAISLRPLLAATTLARLRRLGQVHVRPDRPQLLDKKTPARRRLQSDFHLLALETAQKSAHALAVGWTDPAALTSADSVSSRS